MNPSVHPTAGPSIHPILVPTVHPTAGPSSHPTMNPSVNPSIYPSMYRSVDPTARQITVSVYDVNTSNTVHHDVVDTEYTETVNTAMGETNPKRKVDVIIVAILIIIGLAICFIFVVFRCFYKTWKQTKNVATIATNICKPL
eukprot:91343_1